MVEDRNDQAKGGDDAPGDDHSAGPAAEEPAFRGAPIDDAVAEDVLDAAGVDGEFDADAAADDPAAADPPEEPEPEETLSQPLYEPREDRTPTRAELIEAYGYVRGFFKHRPGRYRGLQRRLKQARIRDTYDEYLADSARLAAAAGVLVGVVTAAVALTLAAVGVELPLVGAGVSAATVVQASVVGLLLGLGTALATWGVRNYYLPRRAVAARRREINLTLPAAITFMYALSRGGMNVVEVSRRLADAEDVYGETAHEFDLLVREMDLFGNDLLQAMSNVRALTPSDNFRRFLDDMLGVVESGGDLAAFFQEEAESSMDDAIEEQESFVGTLGMLGELYVVGFVAAPLFIIVVLVVMSFLQPGAVDVITLLVYLVFPLSMVGFLVLVDSLSQPFRTPGVDRSAADRRPSPSPAARADERFEAYQRSQPDNDLQALLRTPIDAFRRRPILSLAATVPVGMLVAAGAVLAGLAEPSIPALQADPLGTTWWLGIAPFLLATVPVAVLHEHERRRALEISERFPEVLSILASANRMGIGVVDAFDLVTRWTGGALADELERTRNDVRWNHDLTGALTRLADRLHVPDLSRTMSLLAEGSRSSGDLHGVLQVAATQTRNHARLRRARRREIGSYVAIVVLGFLVYLLVILIMEVSYLQPLADLPEPSVPDAAGDAPIPLAGGPVEQYRVLFIHSTLIQAIGSGLIAGKLAENDALSGLKYSIGLVVLSMAVFALFL